MFRNVSDTENILKASETKNRSPRNTKKLRGQVSEQQQWMQKDNVMIFYVLKEKKVPSRILYPAKAPFKCRSIRKRLQTAAETCPENTLGWRKKERNGKETHQKDLFVGRHGH